MKVKTACTRDCPDACGLVATVEDGRVTKLQGDPEHPVTRGFLCYRTSRFLERQYDPDRLTSPLMRQDGTLRPVGWDEALDRIAETMLRIRDESGGSAILQYKSGGSLGLSKHITEYFFERFGPVAVKSGDICSGAGEAAQETDFGDCDSHDFFDIEHSKTIVLWGKNPYVSNLHLLPALQQAKRRGARLIQIDPVHHRGADLCDLHLQPRPGGDLALALGMIRLLFARGLVDPAAPTYCDGLDGLEAAAMQQDVASWCERADVPVAQLESLVEAYADGPSAILVGWGVQRRTHGSAAVRLMDAVAAISGNLGIAGGGVSFYYKRRGAFDLSFMKGLDGAPRSIPEPLLGQGILEAKDPPIRMVWVHNGNPVAALPDSSNVARALSSRELTVVVDSFLTDTASCADVVLPTTTMLEDEDLVGAFGHHWLSNVRQVVPPPAGVKTDYAIVQALAPRVGLEALFGDSIEVWKRRLLSQVSDRGADLESLKRGTVRNPLATDQLHRDRRFATPGGKVRLITEVDSTPPATQTERPLLLAAIATEKAQASQWPARKQQGPARLTVHPASANGFAEGQVVQVISEVGSLSVVLAFDAKQRRDMALMHKGGWFRRGRCANALIPARATDAGEGAVYYDTPVRLAPVDSVKEAE